MEWTQRIFVNMEALFLLVFSALCISNAESRSTENAESSLVTGHTLDDKDFPRIIHQVHFATLPSNQVNDNIIEATMKTHRDYEYRLWREEDVATLIANDYRSFFHAYLTYPYALQRYKVAPYFILRKHGGIFVDTSLEPKKNFEPVVTDSRIRSRDCVIGQDEDSMLSSEFMMCKAESPFLTFVTSHIQNVSQSDGIPYYTVEFTSGSGLLTTCYNIYTDKRHVTIWSQIHFRNYFQRRDKNTWATWLGFKSAWLEPYRCSWLCWLLFALLLPMFAICCVCLAGVIAQRNNALYYRVAYVKHH